MDAVTTDPRALAALAQGRHGDPFAWLGRHGSVVRTFLPGRAPSRWWPPPMARRLAR